MKIIVIGAGLAGAATAHALAERGCDVTVLEASAPPGQQPSPQSSASAAPSAGLPVALMAPHHAAQARSPGAISQLSHLGLAATTAAAQALLIEGRDWLACGALQRAGKLGPQAHWFAQAAWVKPAALVAAWLAHPRITLRYGAAVQRLQRAPGQALTWQALSGQGSVLAEAQAVVLANAAQAQALWAPVAVANGAAHAPALPLHPVAGQVIMGPWNAAWQALWPQLLPELAMHRPVHSLAHETGQAPHAQRVCAVNGNGHFIPAVPWQGGHIWLSGSTYEHEVNEPHASAAGLRTNLQRLQQLIPAAAPLLAEQHSAGQLHGWAGNRCTTRDRLPLVGAASRRHAPGIYLCTAMGSRGLSYATVCGQQLAATITGAQSPYLPEHLQRAVDAARFF
jgi:tRNA 5-methylaminomethyl-2-thiouridine biosynthesis bifunctional protein